ncbi:hypothetical protein QR680_011232 [Steinernema hermaphroditum]|uniref:Protein CASC3 n=1 Tax=Steinernema hermaphroditum TaxID=289476 RepID=A0AA39IRM8_9BILA|nr:hypothetical protein QR680_011232 [Steinernema hermaphroditum]
MTSSVLKYDVGDVLTFNWDFSNTNRAKVRNGYWKSRLKYGLYWKLFAGGADFGKKSRLNMALEIEGDRKKTQLWNVDLKTELRIYDREGTVIIQKRRSKENYQNTFDRKTWKVHCGKHFSEVSCVEVTLRIINPSLLHEKRATKPQGERVKIGIDWRTLYVDKQVLCSQCKVFDQMLKSEFIEKRENFIDCSHIGYDVFIEFLNYLYFGHGVNMKTYLNLFELAHMYECDELQQKCTSWARESKRPIPVFDKLYIEDRSEHFANVSTIAKKMADEEKKPTEDVPKEATPESTTPAPSVEASEESTPCDPSSTEAPASDASEPSAESSEPAKPESSSEEPAPVVPAPESPSADAPVPDAPEVSAEKPSEPSAKAPEGDNPDAESSEVEKLAEEVVEKVDISEQKETGEEGEEENGDKDEDEIETSPAYIPKSGNFYQHDSRNGDAEGDDDDTLDDKKPKSRADGAWSHDRFNEKYQRPKTSQEIISKYGFDIRRNGETEDEDKPAKKSPKTAVPKKTRAVPAPPRGIAARRGVSTTKRILPGAQRPHRERATSQQYEEPTRVPPVERTTATRPYGRGGVAVGRGSTGPNASGRGGTTANGRGGAVVNGRGGTVVNGRGGTVVNGRGGTVVNARGGTVINGRGGSTASGRQQQDGEDSRPAQTYNHTRSFVNSKRGRGAVGVREPHKRFPNANAQSFNGPPMRGRGGHGRGGYSSNGRGRGGGMHRVQDFQGGYQMSGRSQQSYASHPRQPTDIVYFDPNQQVHSQREAPQPREKKRLEIVSPEQSQS